MDILYLFLHALVASTLIPISSEIGLATLVYHSPDLAFVYFLVATAGNTLGSIISYFCGKLLTSFQKVDNLSNAKNKWFNRLKQHGEWILLMAWLPIIGDFLCVGAGILKLNFYKSAFFILIGKAVRYAIVIWIFL